MLFTAALILTLTAFAWFVLTPEFWFDRLCAFLRSHRIHRS